MLYTTSQAEVQSLSPLPGMARSYRLFPSLLYTKIRDCGGIQSFTEFSSGGGREEDGVAELQGSEQRVILRRPEAAVQARVGTKCAHHKQG